MEVLLGDTRKGKLRESKPSRFADALVATAVNYRLNAVSTTRTRFVPDNLLDSEDNPTIQTFLKQAEKSFIVLGDMFYDTEFAEKVLTWLKR
ncbi:hypothetical protein ANCDUO_11947 [Ancylostoma duodenale]|uniref:Uncharacterized protein n=1 Tax=Ancylostoma duodenale TaxID=51022 RepID=A0A0C2GA85_9BILA|nr:hypothetical protein ANCDUO_11947 [Ancylostoma duodenale]